MPEQVRVGLIGAGRIGTLHAENLAHRIPEAELLAVADVYEPAAENLAHKLDIAHVYGDPAQLLARDDIDAVVICSSTDTHAEMIRAAAAAGKQIFCEKPIDRDLEVIDEALAAVEEAGCKFQVGFNRRFDPGFSRIRELIATGGIGEPHILRITSRDPAPPPIDYVKVSGGLFMDMMIHDFDMARFLMGEVVEVYSQGAVLVDSAIGEAGDVDTAIVTLRFANGALGTIDNSRRAVYGYDQRVEAFGSKGAAIAGNQTPDQVVVSDATGVHGATPVYFFVERYTEAYIAEMRAFLQAILNDAPTPVTGIDGRQPVVMAYAALRSLQEHRPVRLDEIDS